MIPDAARAPREPDDDIFTMANRAFDLFTLAERRDALETFALLRYPSIEDRFVEAVHRVIVEIMKDKADA